MRAVALAITLFSLTAATGCGKDEPAPAVTPPPSAASTPSTPEKAPGPASKADPADKGDNGDLGAANTPVKEAVAQLKPAAVPSAAAPVPARPASHLELPELVTAVIGAPSFATTVTAFTDATRAFGAPTPADPVAAALDQLKRQAGVSDVAWLATDRPLRVAVPNPKDFPDGLLALVPITQDPAAVTQALALSPADGHAGKRTTDGRVLYVDFHQGHLVLSSHPALWAKLRGFVDTTLLAWTPRAPLVVELSIGRLRAIYAAEYDVARGLGRALATQMAKKANIPAQADTIKGAVQGVFTFADNTDRLSIAVRPSAGHLNLEVGLTGVAGSVYARTIDTLQGRSLAMLDTIPTTAWFAAASNIDPALLKPDEAALKAQLMTSGRQGPALSEAQATRVAKRTTELFALSDGPSVMSLSTQSGFPLTLNSAISVRDGAKAEPAMVEIMETVWEVMMAGLKQRLSSEGASLSELPLGSFSAALGFLDNVGQSYGISAKATASVERRGDADVSLRVARFDFDWAKVKPVLQRSPGTYDALHALLRERLEVALARGPARLAIGVGPDAASAAAAAVAMPGSPAGTHVLSPYTSGTFFALGLRLGAMLQAYAVLPRAAPYRAQLAKLPTQEAYAMTAASDGTWLTLHFGVPIALTRALLDLR